MILVTVGTHEDPFDRLLRAISSLPDGEEIVVQHGASSVRPENATCVAYLGYDELAALMSRARVVVSHAGVGSIMTALGHGKKPIVVPRLARYGEHVDDHQLELGRRLEQEGLVVLVEDEARLPEAVASHRGDGAGRVARPARLTRELRMLLRERIEVAGRW